MVSKLETLCFIFRLSTSNHSKLSRTCFYLLDYLQGPTDFTETLNRVTVITLAILIKTRGIADAEHLLYLQNMLEQIMATSHHTWSEKTLHHFPSVLREALSGRIDKRSLDIQTWQQVCYSNYITISITCFVDQERIEHMMEPNFGFILQNCLLQKSVGGWG